MTKVEAIVKVMQDNGGLANWAIIYNEIEKYYPTIKQQKAWTAGVRGVLYRGISNHRNFKKIDDGLFALIQYDENSLFLDEYAKDTETATVIKIRKGQSKFRDKLLKKLKPQCPITQINDKRLLVASHIKPWALSNDIERLDTDNGFVLSTMVDRLFDGGLITFSLKKEIIISKSLSIKNAERIGIQSEQIISKLPVVGREKYLKYHQNKVFLK